MNIDKTRSSAHGGLPTTTIATAPIPTHLRLVTLVAEITNSSEEFVCALPASYLPTYLQTFLATATVTEFVESYPLLVELATLLKFAL
jgi:hypothetical protein